MKKTEKREVKYFRDTVVSLSCDLCKRRSPTSFDWANSPNFVDEITITRRCGNVWPEGDFTDTTEVDLCPGCFERFLNWLKEQGGSYTERPTCD